MMDEPKYKRVLLKISGEALAGDKHFGLDFQVMGQVADVIRECVAMGVQCFRQHKLRRITFFHCVLPHGFSLGTRLQTEA